MEGMVPDMALGRPAVGRSVAIFDLCRGWIVVVRD